MQIGNLERSSPITASYRFATFQLVPAKELLFENNKPVRIGSRALRILTALVERAGELVGKTELISLVWPNTFVEEGNLKVHIAALRRVLGDANGQLIANIPGRGYRFIGDVILSEFSGDQSPSVTPSLNNVPALLTRVIGRDEAIEAARTLLGERRLVTIVGAGGIGKTTLALSVAHSLVDRYSDGIVFVDLAPVADQKLILSALAAHFGLAIHSSEPLPRLVDALRGKHLLIVLDSCEHVVDAIAALAEAIVGNAPGIHILATSREPLRAPGEWVQRLAPLEVPAGSTGLTAESALVSPAVQLFVERARAGDSAFALTDAIAPVVADVCRKLDGIALAIELVAVHVPVLGVQSLADMLDSHFRLMTRERRHAPERHRTLSAALDWSYNYLAEHERVILRRLSVFAGYFTLEAARKVLEPEGGDHHGDYDVVDSVIDLVAKSLVIADIGQPVAQYRLLDTTRAYAYEKLAAAGEQERFERRHAEYYCDLFQRVEGRWETEPSAQLLANYEQHLDNVRVALDWAYSSRGDTSLAVALTAAALPLWMHLSLMTECRQRAEQAIAFIAQRSEKDLRREMQLHTTLSVAALFTNGFGPEVIKASSRALEIAEQLNDIDYQLRALWALWIGRTNNGEHREALSLADRFTAIASKSAIECDVLVGERLLGSSLHVLGHQTEAREHTEAMLRNYPKSSVVAHISRFVFDQRALARSTLVVILWLQGFPDQAMKMVTLSVDEVLASGHAVSICNTLSNSACPLAQLNGDLEALERFATMTIRLATEHGLDLWRNWGTCYAGILASQQGNVEEGLEIFQSAFAALPAKNSHRHYIALMGELAEAEGRAGNFGRGLAQIEAALKRAEGKQELSRLPELQRIKADLLLGSGDAAAIGDAEELLYRSLELARSQGALSWELRTAISLCRFWKRDGRDRLVPGLLHPLRERFSEGFETRDLRMARSLLDGSAVSSP